MAFTHDRRRAKCNLGLQTRFPLHFESAAWGGSLSPPVIGYKMDLKSMLHYNVVGILDADWLRLQENRNRRRHSLVACAVAAARVVAALRWGGAAVLLPAGRLWEVTGEVREAACKLPATGRAFLPKKKEKLQLHCECFCRIPQLPVQALLLCKSSSACPCKCSSTQPRVSNTLAPHARLSSEAKGAPRALVNWSSMVANEGARNHDRQPKRALPGPSSAAKRRATPSAISSARALP